MQVHFEDDNGNSESLDITDRIAVVYAWDEAAETWLIYVPNLPEVPGLNTLATLEQGRSYWSAATEPLTWAVATGATAFE